MIERFRDEMSARDMEIERLHREIHQWGEEVDRLRAELDEKRRKLFDMTQQHDVETKQLRSDLHEIQASMANMDVERVRAFVNLAAHPDEVFKTPTLLSLSLSPPPLPLPSPGPNSRLLCLPRAIWCTT